MGTSSFFSVEQYLGLIYDDYLDVIRVQVGAGPACAGMCMVCTRPFLPSSQPNITCPPSPPESELFLPSSFLSFFPFHLSYFTPFVSYSLSLFNDKYIEIRSKRHTPVDGSYITAFDS
jgi:hypothetical protein